MVSEIKEILPPKEQHIGEYISKEHKPDESDPNDQNWNILSNERNDVVLDYNPEYKWIPWVHMI